MSTLSILRCLQRCSEGLGRIEEIFKCSGLNEKDFIVAKQFTIAEGFVKECDGYLQISEKGKAALDELHEAQMNFKRALEDNRKRSKG